MGIRDYGGGTVGIDGNSGGLWGRTAILGEAVKADGNSGRPYPTQTGQRSSELTANSG